MCSWRDTQTCRRRRCWHPRHPRHQQKNGRTVTTTEQWQSSNSIAKHHGSTRPSILSFILSIDIFTHGLSSSQRSYPGQPGSASCTGLGQCCPVCRNVALTRRLRRLHQTFHKKWSTTMGKHSTKNGSGLAAQRGSAGRWYISTASRSVTALSQGTTPRFAHTSNGVRRRSNNCRNG